VAHCWSDTGKGGRGRDLGLDEWGRAQLTPSAPAAASAASLRPVKDAPIDAGGRDPAAAITDVAATALLGRSLGAEALLQQLVQIGLGVVLVLGERVHEL
jgi:hypothetical protein